MHDEDVSSWSAEELIANVFHELRQSAHASRSLIKAVAEGPYEFSSEEQKGLLLALQKSILDIFEVQEWIRRWSDSHRSDSTRT